MAGQSKGRPVRAVNEAPAQGVIATKIEGEMHILAKSHKSVGNMGLCIALLRDIAKCDLDELTQIQQHTHYLC